MDTYLAPLVFFFLALLSCVASQTCERSHYENCLSKLLSFTDRGNLHFASTADELQQECVQARASLHCLTTYTKKCLPPEERVHANDELSGPERVTLGLCTQENFQRGYINSLPCLRNISEGLQYCKEKYERNQKDIILVEYEDKTHLKCCSFDGYRRCLRMVMDTQDGCREGTLMFLEELGDRLGGALTQGTCSEHFERCTGHSSGIRNQLSTFSLIAAILTVGMLVL